MILECKIVLVGSLINSLCSTLTYLENSSIRLHLDKRMKICTQNDELMKLAMHR